MKRGALSTVEHRSTLCNVQCLGGKRLENRDVSVREKFEKEDSSVGNKNEGERCEGFMNSNQRLHVRQVTVQQLSHSGRTRIFGALAHPTFEGYPTYLDPKQFRQGESPPIRPDFLPCSVSLIMTLKTLPNGSDMNQLVKRTEF